MKCVVVFFFKQKTAYEMCGRDWSSDVCSSDLDADLSSLPQYQLTSDDQHLLETKKAENCTICDTPADFYCLERDKVSCRSHKEVRRRHLSCTM